MRTDSGLILLIILIAWVGEYETTCMVTNHITASLFIKTNATHQKNTIGKMHGQSPVPWLLDYINKIVTQISPIEEHFLSGQIRLHLFTLISTNKGCFGPWIMQIDVFTKSLPSWCYCLLHWNKHLPKTCQLAPNLYMAFKNCWIKATAMF